MTINIWHIVFAGRYKLKITRDQCIANSVAAVKFAKSLVGDEDGDVEFSPEDAGRSDPDFLAEVRTNVFDEMDCI
jgi:2-isopropylmalate synthase